MKNASTEERIEMDDGSIKFKVWHTRQHDKRDVALWIIWTTEANRVFDMRFRARTGKSDVVSRIFAETDVNQEFIEAIPVERVIGIRAPGILEKLARRFRRVLLERVDEAFVLDAPAMNETIARLSWAAEQQVRR